MTDLRMPAKEGNKSQTEGICRLSEVGEASDRVTCEIVWSIYPKLGAVEKSERSEPENSFLCWMLTGRELPRMSLILALPGKIWSTHHCGVPTLT